MGTLAAHLVRPVSQLTFLGFLIAPLTLAVALRAPRRRRGGAADRVVALDQCISEVGHRERREGPSAVGGSASVCAKGPGIGRERGRRARARVAAMRKRAEQFRVFSLDPFGIEALRLAQLRIDVAAFISPGQSQQRPCARQRSSKTYTTRPRSLPFRGFFIRYSANSRVSLVSWLSRALVTIMTDWICETTRARPTEKQGVSTSGDRRRVLKWQDIAQCARRGTTHRAADSSRGRLLRSLPTAESTYSSRPRCRPLRSRPHRPHLRPRHLLPRSRRPRTQTEAHQASESASCPSRHPRSVWPWRRAQVRPVWRGPSSSL